jgi:hypothetical protein
VGQQVEEHDNYHSHFKDAITSYWDMFSHGSTDYSVQCQVCGNFSSKEQPFTDLILKFDDSHHTDNKKSNVCTLGELLKTYISSKDIIDDYACDICNRSTLATVHNRVRQYPRVLCIAISRSSYNGGWIKTCVDFPFENFKPKEHSLFQDDADDTSYDLVATIYHFPRGKNGGHYTAICKQHHSGVWYQYDDHGVTVSDFSKSYKGVPTVKKEFQRATALLFYIRRQPTQVDASIVTGVDGNDDGSTNSTHNSRTSKISVFANANITTQSNAQNDNDKDDDCHIEGNMTTALDQDKVCVSVISAPIILYRIVHVSYINVLHSGDDDS